jgi:hypothetical protein
MWIMPTLRYSSGISASRRKRMMLRTLKAQTPAKMKKKLKTSTLKLRSRVLPQPEVMAPFLLLDPVLLKLISLLPQLHLPTALLLLLSLKLCSTENFKFY